MDRNELNQQFRQLLESTVIPEAEMKMPDGLHSFWNLKEFVRAHVPEKLFRFRNTSHYSLDSFARDTITLCSADVFPDRFDSVVYVNQEKIRNDIRRGFDWTFQKNIIDELKKTGHFSREWIQICGHENATKLAEIYKSIPDEVIRMAGEEGKKRYLEMLLDNILPLATSVVDAMCRNRETKIACFTEDIHSPYMWDRYADGYKGFALAYDLSGVLMGDSAECPEERVYPDLYPVIYSDSKYDATEITSWILNNTFYRFQGLGPCPCPDMLYGVKSLLYKDAEGYRHEREWRLMCTCAYAKDSQFIEIESAQSRLKAIYYGPYIAEDKKEQLREYAKNLNIEEYIVKLDNNQKRFDLVIEPL